MSNPMLPSALMSPLFSSAAMREIVSDQARLQRMLKAEAALAAAEASLGVIPASRRKADRQCLPGEILRHRRARPCRGIGRQSRDPAGQGADRRSRQARCRGRALRALGRDQPGHHRHRAGARIARGDRRSRHRTRSRDPGFHHARREAPAYADGRAHLAAAGLADAVRAESRGLCRGADARARAAEAGAQRGPGAAIRRRHRHARGARRARHRRRRSPSPRNSTCRCRTVPGTPTATGWRKSRARSRSSPAPAARSRAMWRC